MNPKTIGLGNSFAACQSLIDPAVWRGIISGGDHDQSPQALIDRIRDYIAGAQAPPYLAELARLEWYVRKVQNQTITLPESLDQMDLNPTLFLLDLSWTALATLLWSSDTSALQPGREFVLIWKHPATGDVHAEPASSEALLILKMVSENITAREVADLGGLPLSAVQAAIDRASEEGIVFLPSSRIRRTPWMKETTPCADDQFQASSSFSLQLHITQECDLHCRHCYDRTERPALTLAQSLNILDELDHFCRDRKVRGHVSFTGGNPLLHPDFPAMYQAAADYGFTTAVLGNPSNESQIEKIQAIQPLSFFQVSLEGLPDYNDYIRGRNHFDATMAFLKLLRRMHVYSMVMLTLTKDNIDQVIPLGEYLQDKTDAFFFNRLALVGEGALLALPPKEAYISFLEQYLAASKRLPVLGLKDNLLNITLKQQGMAPFGGCTGFGCGAAFNFLAVLSDGEVHACRKFPSGIGNLRTQSMTEIYDSEAAKSYREGSSECRSCSLRPVCGGCLACTYSHGLNIFERKDPYCYLRES